MSNWMYVWLVYSHLWSRVKLHYQIIFLLWFVLLISERYTCLMLLSFVVWMFALSLFCRGFWLIGFHFTGNWILSLWFLSYLLDGKWNDNIDWRYFFNDGNLSMSKFIDFVEVSGCRCSSQIKHKIH